MTIKITKLIYLSMVIFLIVGISGCTDSKSGILSSISKSSISSKLAASENSGIFSETAYPMPLSPCKDTLSTYQAIYKNGDTLKINFEEKTNPCDNYFVRMEYFVKNPNTKDNLYNPGDLYKYWTNSPLTGEYSPMYSGPSGNIEWTNDGRVYPSSNGDINEANELINLGKNKANEIVKRYKSGQLR